MLNTNKIRKDFPILKRKINGYPLIYFDNGATSQKPKQVIEAMNDYYFYHNANINRGNHTLGMESTDLYQLSRINTAKFIKAGSSKEIIFVRNATEAINLVAYSWGLDNIQKNQKILITEMEHHSNLVPWQNLVSQKGAKLSFIPFDDEGLLDISRLEHFIDSETKILSLVHVSNVFGTINPIKKIIKIAKTINPKIKILIDASQSCPHFSLDVKDLDCDFLVFTGHKMLGPMGIGVLYAKEELLNSMKPFLFGGDMIKTVSYKQSTWNDLPEKFEAGTPYVSGAVGLSSAINYLENVGLNNIRDHEIFLTKYLYHKLKDFKKIEIYGTCDMNIRSSVISFNIKGIHPHDIAEILDQKGIAVRAGHHCAMPLHTKLNIPASTRISLYLYNTKKEIDIFLQTLESVYKQFSI